MSINTFQIYNQHFLKKQTLYISLDYGSTINTFLGALLGKNLQFERIQSSEPGNYFISMQSLGITVISSKILNIIDHIKCIFTLLFAMSC